VALGRGLGVSAKCPPAKGAKCAVRSGLGGDAEKGKEEGGPLRLEKSHITKTKKQFGTASRESVTERE